MTYDEDKDLLRYTNVDGAITVTFDTQNNVKEPTAVYYKFNEALHPVGQMYRQTYDEIFDEWYDKYVPEPDCEYGIKVCNVFPYQKNGGAVGEWTNDKKSVYQYALDIAAEWCFDREDVGLLYSKEELDMLKD